MRYFGKDLNVGQRLAERSTPRSEKNIRDSYAKVCVGIKRPKPDTAKWVTNTTPPFDVFVGLSVISEYSCSEAPAAKRLSGKYNMVVIGWTTRRQLCSFHQVQQKDASGRRCSDRPIAGVIGHSAATKRVKRAPLAAASSLRRDWLQTIGQFQNVIKGCLREHV